MRKDIMVDLETLGVSTDSTVFQISAAMFDIRTGEIIDTFDMCCDIEKMPVAASGSTIKWWLNTNKELLARLLMSGECSELEMFQKFHEWIGDGDKETFLWGNGILFDNNFIRDKFTAFGMKYPIYYRNDRDVRTILELAVMKSGMTEADFRKQFVRENPELHNALEDVKYQVEMVHQCYKVLMGDYDIFLSSMSAAE